MYRKYTHLTARTTVLAKAIANVRIPLITGRPVSETYWRFREGKYVLTEKDGDFLIRLSALITRLRRNLFFPSLPDKKGKEYGIKQEHTTIRSNILALIDKIREVIEKGSMPLYISTICNADTPFIATAIALMINSTQNLDDQKFLQEFIKNIDLETLGSISRNLKTEYLEQAPIVENRRISPYKWLHQKEYPMFYYTVKWQIRTDFGHRSSKGNNINSYLSFLWDADPVTSPKDETHLKKVGELMDQFEDQRGIANQASSQKNIDKEILALHTKNCIEIMQEIQNEITTWMEEYDSCQ